MDPRYNFSLSVVIVACIAAALLIIQRVLFGLLRRRLARKTATRVEDLLSTALQKHPEKIPTRGDQYPLPDPHGVYGA